MNYLDLSIFLYILVQLFGHGIFQLISDVGLFSNTYKNYNIFRYIKFQINIQPQLAPWSCALFENLVLQINHTAGIFYYFETVSYMQSVQISKFQHQFLDYEIYVGRFCTNFQINLAMFFVYTYYKIYGCNFEKNWIFSYR